MELKKIQAKGDNEGMQGEEEMQQNLRTKASKKEIARAISLEKKIG